MDVERARQILSAESNIQVLYDGSPVWIESVNENNTAEVTFLNNHNRVEAPVYKLVEVSPANRP